MPNAAVQLSAFKPLLSYSTETILKSISNHCMTLSSPSSNPSPPIYLLTPENKRTKYASTDEQNSKPKHWTWQSWAPSSDATQLQSTACRLDNSEQSRELNYFNYRAIYSVIQNMKISAFFCILAAMHKWKQNYVFHVLLFHKACCPVWRTSHLATDNLSMPIPNITCFRGEQIAET